MKKLITQFAAIMFCSQLFLTSASVFANTKQELAVSVQLWSVKDTLKKDFVGTLTKLADMGFNGVEFAGFYGPYQEQPEALRQLLDSLNLKASAAHVGFDVLASDVIHKNLLFFKTLGINHVIVPWDERAWDPKKVSLLTAQLTQLDQILARYGMSIGFHNHQHEFAEFKQSTFWDYIAENTPESVVLQLDVGWVRYAGKDPVDYINRYPGRMLTTHFKIRSKPEESLSPIIGDNDIAWGKLIDASIKTGGAQWIVMEQEEYPNDLSELDAVALSKKGLDRFIGDYVR